MAQMYKVFFKERTIFINDSPMIACVTYGINSIEEVDRYVYKIINEELKYDICIVYSEPKVLFKYFKSKFTYVKTAGGLVFNTENKFLAIFRKGKWDLPKGHIEKNEKNKVAAIREVEEETGITAPSIVRKLPTTYHIYRLKGNWELKKCTWYLMRYEGTERLVPETKEDITKCKWFKITEKSKFMNETYNSIKEVMNAVI